MDESHQLEERVRMVDEDSEALLAARAHVNQVTADCAWLTAGTKQGKAERDTSVTSIHNMDIVPANHHGQTGVVMWAVRSLKSRVATGGDRANTAEDRAPETLDKMYELQILVQELSLTFTCECGCVAELIYAELKRIWSVITLALLQRERTVSEVICR